MYDNWRLLGYKVESARDFKRSDDGIEFCTATLIKRGWLGTHRLACQLFRRAERWRRIDDGYFLSEGLSQEIDVTLWNIETLRKARQALQAMG